MDDQFLSGIKDFIQFKHLVAEDVLIIFYVFCALALPFFAWYFLLWVIRRYAVLYRLYKTGQYSIFFSFVLWVVRKIKFFRDKIDEKITWHSFSLNQKLKFLAMFVIMVGFSELFLRLMFEYLIAYIHIHDWLKPVTVS